jgi:hypothetical protein
MKKYVYITSAQYTEKQQAKDGKTLETLHKTSHP